MALSRRPRLLRNAGTNGFGTATWVFSTATSASARDLGLRAQCEHDVEFVGDVVAEQQPRREVPAQSLRFPAQPFEIVEQFRG